MGVWEEKTQVRNSEIGEMFGDYLFIIFWGKSKISKKDFPGI